jgi:hypothetical protein
MKIISIDVGIKNLAFCLFESDSIDIKNTFKIKKWDSINVAEKDSLLTCTHLEKNVICLKPAKYRKANQCFCLKHAKKQCFLIPTSQLKPSYINKQKIQDLYDIADKYNISFEKPIKKLDLSIKVNEYMNNICFEELHATHADQVDLITIGNNIKYKFDELFMNEGKIDYVIIENQISPIANRMKTIQGMIAQYFIMREQVITIQFISACNKLKEFNNNDVVKEIKDKKDKDKIDKDKKEEKTIMNYSERKKLGILKCLDIIQKEAIYFEWLSYFEKHKKKDDLSDSFLQGIWFIKSKLIL